MQWDPYLVGVDEVNVSCSVDDEVYFSAQIYVILLRQAHFTQAYITWNNKKSHDDVIKWETFSALPAICAGNSPVTGEFPAQRPLTWSFDVFFELRLNQRLSKQWWGWWFETPSGSLWRHCNYLGIWELIHEKHDHPCVAVQGLEVDLHIMIAST